MNDELRNKLLELVEYYYGDCNCDHIIRCKFCRISEDIKQLK